MSEKEIFVKFANGSGMLLEYSLSNDLAEIEHAINNLALKGRGMLFSKGIGLGFNTQERPKAPSRERVPGY
jgi:hypothetical protein